MTDLTHLAWQWLGWAITTWNLILADYYHPAYDFVRDGVIDACDFQYAINKVLEYWTWQ